MKFDFSYFPDENEIIEDINRILVNQYDNKTVLELANRILTYHENNECDASAVEMDAAGMEYFCLVGQKALRLSDLEPVVRETIAILWVNYMCEKERGEIVQMVGNLIYKGVDYKRIAMESLAYGKNGETDQEVQDGSLMYLWTMGCVARALYNAMEQNPEEIGDIPEPHMYMGLSLN